MLARAKYEHTYLVEQENQKGVTKVIKSPHTWWKGKVQFIFR